jgi:hypothetical protein
MRILEFVVGAIFFSCVKAADTLTEQQKCRYTSVYADLWSKTQRFFVILAQEYLYSGVPHRKIHTQNYVLSKAINFSRKSDNP